MSKYNSQKIEIDGIVFDSKKEANRWRTLKHLDKMGKITELRRQVKYLLIPAQKIPNPQIRKGYRTKRTEKAVYYIADFVYRDQNGNEVVEDVKGYMTDLYRIKKKLMLYVFGIQIKEV